MAPPLLDAIRMIIGGMAAAIGLTFIFAGAIGHFRLPDLYTRLHAVNVADGVGAAFMLAGLALMAPDAATGMRIALLGVLVVAVGPALTHAVASAAHGGGLAPIAGRYEAPRPALGPEGGR